MMTIMLTILYLIIGLVYSRLHLKAWEMIKEKYPRYMVLKERFTFFIMFPESYFWRYILNHGEIDPFFIFKRSHELESLYRSSSKEVSSLSVEQKLELSLLVSLRALSINDLIDEKITFPPHVLRIDLGAEFEDDERKKFLALFNAPIQKKEELNSFLRWYYLWGVLFWGIRFCSNVVFICMIFILELFMTCGILAILLIEIVCRTVVFISKLKAVKWLFARFS